jgi:hypothetical protein
MERACRNGAVAWVLQENRKKIMPTDFSASIKVNVIVDTQLSE